MSSSESASVWVRTLVALALCAGLTLPGSSAGAHEGDCKPTFTWDYTEQELEVIATFDLSECWGDEPFVGRTRFWRFDQTASPLADPPSQRDRWKCLPNRSRTCRVEVSFQHPVVETADYQLDLHFWRQNGKRAGYGLLLPRCISAGPAYSACGP
ncbi:MAG: hypothetical protein M3454_07430 [Actinomycetota bacterium]|nr:hypothetical protein [Actinomycetota bacterium]